MLYLLSLWRVYLFAVILAASFIALLHYFPKHRRLTIISFSFVSIIVLVVRFIVRIFEYPDHLDFILKGLPFHISGLSAILIPIMVITKSKILFNFVYYICLPAGILPLFLDPTGTNPVDLEWLGFVVPHLLYAIIPIVLIAYKEFRPHYKMLLLVLPSFIIALTGIHGLNHLFAAIYPVEGYPTTNFFFSRYPGEQFIWHQLPDAVYEGSYFVWSEYPILSHIYHFTGWGEYFYLFGLIPLLAVLWGLLSIPTIIKDVRFHRGNKKEVEELLENCMLIDDLENQEPLFE
ncbi:MAG: YwaF family protein [Firmicutes bacterium]|nr:YwaF family protein [Bacillota bacterium]